MNGKNVKKTEILSVIVFINLINYIQLNSLVWLNICHTNEAVAIVGFPETHMSITAPSY